MVLKIFRAADAFLYLPTYVAEEYGIFETLLEPLGIKKVEFHSSRNGDIEAIKTMLSENDNTKDSISIAIADPVAFLSKQLKLVEVDEVRVIGAIIDKLPFWAVNHTDKKFDSISDFSKEFSEVVYYNENLVTGHYLGIKVKTSSKISGHGVSFGQEITTINKIAKENPARKAVAITADIISLVKGKCLPQNQLKINYWFSKEGPFLTTGILTSKKCCEHNSKILIRIIEAIQKSISIIYSSNKIAEQVCKTVSEKPTFNSLPLTTNEIKSIIDLIYEEKFYPADLNISEEGWNKAVKAIAKTEHWESEDENAAINTSFTKYVDNSFVLVSEMTIAKQFGITLESFKNEINEEICLPLNEKIEKLETENTMYKEKQGRVIPLLFKFAAFLTIIFRALTKRVLLRLFIFGIIVIGGAILYHYNDDPITKKDILLTVFGSLIVGFIGTFIYDHLIKGKSSKK